MAHKRVPATYPIIRFRIDFGPRSCVGPGKISLLEQIERCGSLSEAARDLNMSYRRAWQLLDSLNSCFRTPVQERASVIARLAPDPANSVQPLNEWLHCNVPRPNSLTPSQGCETVDAMLFSGAPLWSGAGGATRSSLRRCC